MGMGKSSGQQQTTVQMTPEQKETLAIQNAALKNTFLPAYQNTVTGAKSLYNQTAGGVTEAAQRASNVAGQTGALQGAVGAGSLLSGVQGLQSLFDPNYERNQINAALQSGRESARESQAGQNAMYGGAGGLGSSRMALADTNLASLNAQRQATAAAGAQAQVQANKAAAANQLAAIGGQGLTAANQAAASRIGYAGAPQDLYSKYASIVFGTPQASTNPNYAGTQGGTSTGSSKSAGASFKMPGT
ncbi:hypothetical protein UFOVP566_25 [uncultured Caudovirales phage]|uniref:Uncharacterized protein n=1 Tax=uncultured Caudovirales phage TaxID=2100421 RepID=A0A6J5MWM0_9CAUD|nr:hypothetical protein UFOVP294_60 [uncultured Caudovirales phage]CAB4150361.1 hypothetical protein UFOVP566_25 [uncultured Caudovirales phage]